MKQISGISASKGIAIGKLHLLHQESVQVSADTVADRQGEWARCRAAIESAKAEIRDLYRETAERLGQNEAQVFEIHEMMLEDEDFQDAVSNWILESGYNAAYAVQETGREFARVFSDSGDRYMMERAADVMDISQRVVRLLLGKKADDLAIREPVVIGAPDLMPSETVSLDAENVLAFATESGSPVSHTAILARTMGVPAVVALGDAFADVPDHATVVVDGFEGQLILDPDESTLSAYERKLEQHLQWKKRLQALRGTSNCTKDGVKIEIHANIGHPAEADLVLEHDAGGVGLFRSEFLYLESDHFPTEEEQYEAYRSVLKKLSPRRVVVRTMDLGSDKQAAYFTIPDEENPAMGYRGIRISMDRKDLFATQIRALLRASVHGSLAVMFPMITSVGEIQAVKGFVAEQKAQLLSEGHPVSEQVELGIMIETPAAALCSDLLAQEVDFFSIGTNDLTQYTMAADRMNSKIGHLYDPAHTALLRLIQMVTVNAHLCGKWVGICGESAASLDLLPFYLLTGIDELSVAPSSVLEIREAVQGMEMGRCGTLSKWI